MSQEVLDEPDLASKKCKTGAINYFEILPDGLLAEILSLNIDSQVWYDQHAPMILFRGISHQFRRAIDQSQPCFAFMKMITEEHRRVQESGGTIQSPWFTECETSFLSTGDGTFDTSEPLPAPDLMPFTALQIISSSRYLHSIIAPYRPSVLDVIYAIRCTYTCVVKVQNSYSKFYGREVLCQETFDMIEEYADLDFQPGKRTVFVLNDESTKFTDVDPAPKKYYEDHESTCIFSEEEERQELNQFAFLNCNGKRTEVDKVYPLNLHYTPNKVLLDRLPTLPFPVYQLLSTMKSHNRQKYEDLCRVIQCIKLNMIVKPRTQKIVEKMYEVSLERFNLKQVFDNINILGPRLASEKINDTAFSFRSICEIFNTSLDGQELNRRHKSPYNFAQWLDVQKTLEFDVLLTDPDFERLFVTLFRVPYKNESYRLARKAPFCAQEEKFYDDSESDLTIYSEADDDTGERLQYNVTLVRAPDYIRCKEDQEQIVLKVLRNNNADYYFHFAIKYKEDSVFRWTKKHELDLAIELFEYWFGYWSYDRSFKFVKV